MKVEYCNLLGTNQIGDDFSNGVKDVACFNTLDKPRARSVEPHEEEVIPLNLLAQRELVNAQTKLFRSRGNRVILIRGFDPGPYFKGRTASISCAYHVFLSLLLSEFRVGLLIPNYSPRYAFNRSRSSASFTGFVR